MHITKQTLKSILTASGVIEAGLFDSSTLEAERLGRDTTDVLLEKGALTEEYILQLLEERFHIPIVDLRRVTIPPEILELIPETYARTHKALAFNADGARGVVRVAMLDPFDMDAVEYLRARLRAWIEPFLTTQASLRYGLRQYRSEEIVAFNEVITENVKKFFLTSGEVDLAKLASTIHIVTILNSFVEQAVNVNASDIHFEPFEKQLLVRFRIDGVLQEAMSLHKAVEPILVARVKILANLRIDEHNVPQDGRFKLDIDEFTAVDIRVSVMPVMHGERVVLRILRNTTRPFSLEELGLAAHSAQILMEEVKKPYGMILVTGPTGHGKTTTLYSILNILNTAFVNIMTIEDPIEYEIPRVNQTQVNPKAGLMFATGLRSHLRQNPDIIMVGEIRDEETAEIAVHASLTGHIVLSTLHTNDAPSALPRLVDMKVQPFLLVSTVKAVVAQRLVRKICASCIESYRVPDDLRRLIQKFTSEAAGPRDVPELLYRGRGCGVCKGSGFHGQVGIFEVLVVSQGIQKLILERASIEKIRRLAVEEGMVTMFEDGFVKVEQGVTTIEEVMRVT